MTDVTAAPAAQPVPLSKGYTRYALGLLLVIYIFNFLDRQVVNILAEPIKQDLNLKDWQLGMMSGFAFAVFYTVLGVPIARLAETRNRGLIIASALAAWSGFTVLCGQAQNFLQLCLFRIGVGVGEAGCTPPAHSLISDYVPKEKRASALAFYSMGVPLGSLLGMAMGGVIADAYGWRIAFLVAGAPGLILAVLAAFTLRETRSRLAADVAAARADQPSFGESMRHLAGKRTFWLLAFAAAIKSFISYGHAPFTASFFLRNHGEEVSGLASGFGLQSVGFLGLAIGLISGICGALSSITGGWIADKVGARDVRNILIAPALAVSISVPAFIAAMLADSAVVALALLMIPYLLNYFWYGPVYSTAQSIVPPNMRATSAAVLLFIVNLIGLGLGPLLVGVLSDVYAEGMGLGVAEGVRWSLITASLFGLLSGALFWMARKSIKSDLEG
jgi:MFS family permease